MKTWNRAFFVLMLIVALPSLIIATEISSENQYANIDTEDKIYIQPNCIYFVRNQIYVKLDADLISIQHLFCDSNGVFVSIHDIQMGRARQETWICRNPDCRYENYVGIDHCGLCGWSRYVK